MKSMMKSAVVGAVAAAFVASVAVAQGQGPGPQGRGGRGPGMGGPGGPARGLMQGLTEEQRQQVKAIMDEGRDAQQGPPADAKLRRDLEAELLADTPNDQKIEDLKQQILLAHAEGLSRHISVQKRVTQVLTAEQRAKARERLAQESAEGHRGGARAGGPGGGGKPAGVGR
ncbi:MAG: periplasmic heavy metal sensor [Acidobacteriota bacterium]|nr:periplasmic heavy metal sensor [Acidobacteriota bacterium]